MIGPAVPQRVDMIDLREWSPAIHAHPAAQLHAFYDFIKRWRTNAAALLARQPCSVICQGLLITYAVNMLSSGRSYPFSVFRISGPNAKICALPFQTCFAFGWPLLQAHLPLLFCRACLAVWELAILPRAIVVERFSRFDEVASNASLFHTGIVSCMTKANEAALHGWTLLRFDAAMVRDDVAVLTIARWFEQKGADR